MKIKDTTVHKRFVIPLWIVQILSIVIIFFAVIFELVALNEPDDQDDLGSDPASIDKEKNKIQGAAIYFIVSQLITSALVLTEMIMFCMHRLRIMVFFWLTLVRTALNVPIWIETVIRDNIDGLDAGTAAVSIIFLVLLISYVLGLTYASILLHRHRRNKKLAAAGVQDGYNGHVEAGEVGLPTKNGTSTIAIDSRNDMREQGHGMLPESAASHQSGHNPVTSAWQDQRQGQYNPSTPYSIEMQHSPMSSTTAYDPYRRAEMPGKGLSPPPISEVDSYMVPEADSNTVPKIQPPQLDGKTMRPSYEIEGRPRPSEMEAMGQQRHELPSYEPQHKYGEYRK